MTDEASTLTNLQADYLLELVNIGTGSAAGALSFILRRPVNTKVPRIRFGRLSEIFTLFGHKAAPLTGIRLALTGDVKGSLTFFLAEEHRRNLVEMARERTGAGPRGSDQTVLVLVAQAVATSNLDAVKRFCGLDIHHSNPTLERNLFVTGANGRQGLMIESTFVIDNNQLKTYLLIIPDTESLQALISSIDYASRAILGAAGSNPG